MLHILLMLLKIIGWILLIIVGLFVLLICIVLFVPLRYDVKGSCGGSLDSLEGEVRLSWLLHLVSVGIWYCNKNLIWRLRIAFVKRTNESEGMDHESEGSEAGKKEEDEYEQLLKQLEEMPEPEKKSALVQSETQRSTPDDIKDAQQADAINTEMSQKVVVNKAVSQPEFSQMQVPYEEEDVKHEKKPKKKKNQKTKNHQKNEGYSDHKANKEQQKNTKFFEALEEKFTKCIKKIKYTYEKICDTMKALLEKKELLSLFVENEMHKGAFANAMKEVKHLLKVLLPKRFTAQIHFGFEDPYWTGQVLAIASIFYALCEDNLALEPEFSEKVLDGNLHIKGKIRVGTFVAIGVRLLLDKKVRNTLKDAKQLKNQITGGTTNVRE